MFTLPLLSDTSHLHLSDFNAFNAFGIGIYKYHLCWITYHLHNIPFFSLYHHHESSYDINIPVFKKKVVGMYMYVISTYEVSLAKWFLNKVRSFYIYLYLNKP